MTILDMINYTKIYNKSRDAVIASTIIEPRGFLGSTPTGWLAV